MNAPEWKYLVVGLIGALVLGGSFPVFAILFGDFFGVGLKLFKLLYNLNEKFYYFRYLVRRMKLLFSLKLIDYHICLLELVLLLV